MNNIFIKEIQRKDNESIAAVIREVFVQDGYPKTGTAFADFKLDYMHEAYDFPRSIYYVVEDNGVIIGGAGISPLENATENICELQKMYFLSRARGRGIGFQIIQKCLESAKDFAYEKCYLETLPEMLVAQSLYKKVGFEYLYEPMWNTGHTSCPIWMLKKL